MIFLKSQAPHGTDPFARAVMDHERAGVRVGGGLRSFIPAGEPEKHGVALAPSRRTKLWELSTMLHCSIVGTCLSTSELRLLLRKADANVDRRASDHELHTMAVSSSGQRGDVARRIQKALDERYRPTINRFARAESPDELLHLWDEAVAAADIPAAYWAVLTHAKCTDAVARHAFEDVHMLSHLVGATNRADLRKLRTLEERNAELEEKLARQQVRIREAIVERDARIRDLSASLARRIEGVALEREVPPGTAAEAPVLDRLVADLRKQLESQTRRREHAERKAVEAAAARSSERSARDALEVELRRLTEELAVAESGLRALTETDDGRTGEYHAFLRRTILYVGGRPHQVAHVKALVERAEGELIHHDGGIEDKDALLPAMIGRADVAAFPVDCVSHTAALSLKRLCRQAGKQYLPLRSSSLSSLLHALAGMGTEVVRRRDASSEA